MSESPKPENTPGRQHVPVQPLEGMAGLQATLKDVVKRLLSTTSLECIASNIRGGGMTTYTIAITPAKTGDVYISMDCEVTPVKRTLIVVKGLENGKVDRRRPNAISASQLESETQESPQ